MFNFISRKSLKSFICIAVLFGFFMYVNYNYIGIHRIFYKIDSALELLPFFIIGYCFFEFGIAKKLESMSTSVKIPFAITAIAVGAILGLINNQAKYLSSIYGNIAIFYISALLSILGIIVLSMTIHPLKPFTYCGARTITILVLHKFPILLFQRVIPVTSTYLLNNSVLVGLIVSIISMVLCCVADIVRTRVAPFMIGKRKINKI